jgi:hypothetical protein
MLFSSPVVGLQEFESRSGWHLQPEGLCRDDICVPLPPLALTEDRVDLHAIATALDMPVVEDGGLLAIGPPAREHVLPASAAAPSVVLPDVHGQPFDLRGLLGTKVLLLTWASW